MPGTAIGSKGGGRGGVGIVGRGTFSHTEATAHMGQVGERSTGGGRMGR